jgi:hypothetical protein
VKGTPAKKKATPKKALKLVPKAAAPQPPEATDAALHRRPGHVTREVWLTNLINQLRPMFEKAGYPLPDHVHVSMGFPSTRALSESKRRIGECWDREASMDGNHHIFISPVLHDEIKAAGVVVHELLHAALPSGTGHGPAFAKGMRALGLEGKPTATEESDLLKAQLADVISLIGPYPHAGLNPRMVEKKKQTTRMLKVQCPNSGTAAEDNATERDHPPYMVRMTQKMIDIGTPICPLCGEAMKKDGAEEESEAA